MSDYMAFAEKLRERGHWYGTFLHHGEAESEVAELLLTAAEAIAVLQRRLDASERIECNDWFLDEETGEICRGCAIFDRWGAAWK